MMLALDVACLSDGHIETGYRSFSLDYVALIASVDTYCINSGVCDGGTLSGRGCGQRGIRCGGVRGIHGDTGRHAFDTVGIFVACGFCCKPCRALVR